LEEKVKTSQFFFGCCIITTLFLVSNCTKEQKGIAVSSDGVEINYDITGTGQPTVVLVHGFSNTKELWDSQIEFLSQKYQVISLDLAGFGQSGNNRDVWTMESFGNDVIAVMDKLKVNDVVLVGFSMGGAVILETAQKIPSRIMGLVVVDIFQKIDYQFSPESTNKSVKFWQECFSDKEKIPELFPANMDTTIINKYISMAYFAPKTGWWESIYDFFRWWGQDLKPILSSLKLPLMSINSDYTTTDVESHKKYNPSYKLKTISTIGHLVMWEAPDEFNNLLEECIQEYENQ
jgi:pimeloyl-ACP methyl ester carboxylesterase